MAYLKNAAVILAFCSVIIILSHLIISRSMFCQDGKVLQQVQYILGIEPIFSKQEKIIKVKIPRDDVTVTINNLNISPFMGLTSTISFQKVDPTNQTEAILTGELILFEDEIQPILNLALDNNLEIMSLNNSFPLETPRVYSMHVTGKGSVINLAKNIKKILDNIKSIRFKSPIPNLTSVNLNINSKSNIYGKQIETILNLPGKYKEGIFKVIIGRKDTNKDSITKNREINSWAAFYGQDTQAIVIGNLAVLEDELQPVLKALAAGDINILSIHNHTIQEEPRIIFVHYIGQDTARHLAETLKKALSKTTTLK